MLHIMRNPSIVAFTSLLLTIQVGCASHDVVVPPVRPAPLSEAVRAQFGTVGVLSARFSPEVDVNVRPTQADPESRDGATGGAAAGAAVGASGASALLSYGLLFPPLLIAAGGVLVVSTAGGAIAGAIGDDSEEAPSPSWDRAERAFTRTSDGQVVQIGMRNQVVKAGQTLDEPKLIVLKGHGPSSPSKAAPYALLDANGIHHVLEIKVEHVTLTVDEEAIPLLALDMSVSTQLYRTADGTVLDARTFTCRGGKGPFRDWNGSGSEPFVSGLSRCYEQVADRIIEELFLVYDPHPEMDMNFGNPYSAKVLSDTLQPAIEWDSFPDVVRGDERAQEASPRITGVSYDLRIWRADNLNLPDDLVYERRGLREPFHTVEKPLEPATQYFWTVRARFDLNGRTRVTPWAVSQLRRGYAPNHFDRVTNSFYYRFRTPSIKQFEAAGR